MASHAIALKMITAKAVLLFGVLKLVTLTYGQTEREFLAFRGPCVFGADQSDGNGSCTPRATVLLGGLFPLHSWTEDSRFSLGGYCSGALRVPGFQRMEAMRFAIERVNAEGIIPGVQLTFEMRDSCISSDLSRQQALRFINRGVASGDQCNATTSQPVSGVVGAAASGVSIAAADLLGLFKVPQISYSSTSATLSNKDRYRYFLRTVPPDNFQAQAIMALVNALEANYFSLLYSTGNYGSGGAAEIRAAVSSAMETTSENGIGTCIAVDENIGANEGGVASSVYKQALSKLVGRVGRNASVVVAFSGIVSSLGLLQEAASEDFNQILSNDHVWIASDSWASSEEVLKSRRAMSVARGSLGVKPQSNTVEGFESHFRSLHPNNNTKRSFNPWLSEFWKSVFNCTPDSEDDLERKACRQNNLSNLSYAFQQNAFVPFTVDAVYAFAYAIRLLQQEKCGKGYSGICSAMLSSEAARLGAVDGAALLSHLLNLQFNSSAGHQVAFTSSGDLATAVYDITNLQVDDRTEEGYYKSVGLWQSLTPSNNLNPSRRLVNGVLHSVQCLAGEKSPQFNCTPSELQLNLSAIQSQNGKFGVEFLPQSKCSEACPSGHYANLPDLFPPQFRRCCWSCERCTQHSVTPTQFQMCQRCPAHQRANNNQTSCLDLSPDYWSITNNQAVACVVLSVIGIILTVTLAIIGISVKHLLPHHSALHIEPLLHCLLGALGLFTSVFINTNKPANAICLVGDVWISLSMVLLITPFLVQLFLEIRHHHRKNTPGGKISQPSRAEISNRSSKLRDSRMAILLQGIISATATVVLTLAVASSSDNVQEDIDANIRVQIGCQAKAPIISGVVIAWLISVSTIAAHLYCTTHQIMIHPTLSRAGYIIVVFIIISGAGFGVSRILSPIAGTSMVGFVLVAAAYAFLVIVLIPDVFLTLAPPERRSSTSGGFWKSQRRRSRQRRNSTVEVVATAMQTLQEKSLFNSAVRQSAGKEKTEQIKPPSPSQKPATPDISRRVNPQLETGAAIRMTDSPVLMDVARTPDPLVVDSTV